MLYEARARAVRLLVRVRVASQLALDCACVRASVVPMYGYTECHTDTRGGVQRDSVQPPRCIVLPDFVCARALVCVVCMCTLVTVLYRVYRSRIRVPVGLYRCTAGFRVLLSPSPPTPPPPPLATDRVLSVDCRLRPDNRHRLSDDDDDNAASASYDVYETAGNGLRGRRRCTTSAVTAAAAVAAATVVGRHQK